MDVGTQARAPFIAVAGNIGVGKSGLTRALAESLSARALVEDVEKNPFFTRFYDDPKRWAFSSQVAFAADALRRHLLAAEGGAAIQDRTAYETCDVFARVLHDNGSLDADQLEVLKTLRLCAAAVPRQPDLLIYLDASIPSMVSRIAERDRVAERHVDATYLKVLQEAYERFVTEWDVSRALHVNTDTRDLRQESELAALIEEVKTAV